MSELRRKLRRERLASLLRSMIMEYAELYDLQVALIVRDKTTGNYELFQNEVDENFPPARNSYEPCITYVGCEAEAPMNMDEVELELQEIE